MKIPHIKKTIRHLGLFLGSLSILGACNTPFERAIQEREYSDSVNVSFSKPKVLYIIVDGARGLSVRDAQAPNINSLLSTSIYSWNGLADAGAETNVASYATMLTGVKVAKHGITSDDFNKSKLADFPVLFKRIKEYAPDVKTSVYTTSALLKTELAKDAGFSAQLSDDAAVKTAVVTDLGKDESSVITAQFSGIDQAGQASGYDLSFPAYKAAILKFDGYVGEILTALKKRPKYAEEKWMVIISSNKGGAYELPPLENDNTVFSDTKLNTFTIFHNTSYSIRILSKPFLGNRYQGSFVNFTGNLRALNAGADNSIYNFGDSPFTIEMKVKKNVLSQSYPSLIGKRRDWTHNDIGWNIFLEGGYWMLNARGSKNVTRQVKGADLAAGTWNSIALVCVIKNGGKRYIRTFTNGKFNTESEITDLGSFDNALPLIIGKYPSNGSLNTYISDVKIWKTAFSDETIKQFACDTYVDPGHPFYDYLISYWPMTDGAGSVFKDEGLAKIDLKLADQAVTWGSFADLICSPPSSDLSKLVPGTVDIPAQIYSWLRIPRQESWSLDGRVWLDQ